MASLPVLLQGVHASVAADQLEAEGLAASLMSAIIAAAAEVATNPEFSITREALTDVAVQASRAEVSDELTRRGGIQRERGIQRDYREREGGDARACWVGLEQDHSVAAPSARARWYDVATARGGHGKGSIPDV